MLLLLEGQMDEAWEPSENQFSFGSRGAFYRKVIPFFFFFLAVKHSLLEVSMHPESPANRQIDRYIPWGFWALDHMLSR